MSLSYVARLLCVCLASFFLIHVVLSVITGAMARSAVRVAGRSKLPQALRLLIAMRVLPALLERSQSSRFAYRVICGLSPRPRANALELRASSPRHSAWRYLPMQLFAPAGR